MSSGIPHSMDFSPQYVKNEGALPLKNSKGDPKSRIRLFDYQVEKGKDPYAIAAKVLQPKEKEAPKLNCFDKKRFFLYKHVGADGVAVWYKINKNSFKKRLKIDSDELKGLLDNKGVLQDKRLKGLIETMFPPPPPPPKSIKDHLSSIINLTGPKKLPDDAVIPNRQIDAILKGTLAVPPKKVSASPQNSPPPPAAVPSKLQCPPEVKLFLEKAPQSFVNEVLASPKFSENERKELFVAAKEVYGNFGSMKTNETLETCWVDMKVTMGYLSSLSESYPHFGIIPEAGELNQFSFSSQGEGKKMNVAKTAASLPATLDGTPSIFGHAIRIGGNHRTALVIDLKTQTVEYYNSFGTDHKAKQTLEALADQLTQKYGVKFSYEHKTAGVRIQQDAHQCGIWTCKMIEERVRLGTAFNPANYKKFDIATYRKVVFNNLYKASFHQRVGNLRFVQIQQEAFKIPGFDKAKFGQFMHSKLNNMGRYYRELGETGQLPQELKDKFAEWGYVEGAANTKNG